VKTGIFHWGGGVNIFKMDDTENPLKGNQIY